MNENIKAAMRNRHCFPKRITILPNGIRFHYHGFDEELSGSELTAKNRFQLDALELLKFSPELLDALITECAKNDDLAAQLAAAKALAEERGQRLAELEEA